ncbi:MAG: tetratricopeptide repeat protein [Nannocystaceae bacterium]|nr:tetratricopeptide repeat protein [Nannocystaceae bacterium]
MSSDSAEDSCPAEVVLFRFAEGLLSATELQALERHLAACEVCSDLLSLAADETAIEESPGPLPQVPDTTRMHGRYVILERLGWGAMGIVVRAYDPKLEREVALKQLRASLGPQESERLVKEGRTLAQLNHPHVVAVYDVELEGEQPAIVMEMIRGQTLDEWLETERSWRDILECFRSAGQGLAAAHLAGLLHRDFKPANVMVGRDGRVRVTDFGIAGQLVEPRGQPNEAVHKTQTLATIGTPAYMAPEQHCKAPLTHAADQYAFALTLREALTGTRPFAGLAPKELEAAKRSGAPTWPATTAWPRRVENAIDRAMNPQAERRFPSMEALLAELRPRARRTRSLVWGLGVLGIVGALAVGLRTPEACQGAQRALAATWSSAQRANVAAAYEQSGDPIAAEIWKRIEPSLEDYAQSWVGQHRDACMSTRVRGEQSEALLDKRMSCLDRARRSLQSTLSILSEGDPGSLIRGVDLVEALPHLKRCADRDSLERSTPIPNSDQRERVHAVRSRLASARALQVSGRYVDARAALNDAKNLDTAGYPPVDAELLEQAAALLELEGSYAEAASTLERGIVVATRTGQTLLVARMTRMAIFLGARQGDFSRADAWSAVARGLAQREASGEDAGELAATLGAVALMRGDLPHAETELRAAVARIEGTRGPRSLRVAHVRSNLAACLMQAGRVEESIAEYDAHLSILEERLGPQHPTLARTRQTLGNAYHAMGRLEEALEEHEAALAGRIAAFGADHPEVADSHASIAAVFIDLERLDDAEREARLALQMSRLHHGDAHPVTLVPKSHLARIFSDQLQHEQAIALYREVLRDAQTVFAPGNPQTGIARAGLGHALLDAGQLEEAREVLLASLEERTEIFGPLHRQSVESALGLASCRFRAGSVDLALDALTALEAKLAADESGLALLPHVQQRHAELLLRDDRPKDALPLFRAADAGLADAKNAVAQARARSGISQAREQLGQRSESGKARERDVP